jgi:hypothetical protein
MWEVNRAFSAGAFRVVTIPEALPRLRAEPRLWRQGGCQISSFARPGELDKAGHVKIVTTIADARAHVHAKRRVLVPTMGALHKAHGELIRVAREAAGRDGEVAVSIFVNPLQFEPGSDYKRYPRPEKADEEFCRSAGVDLLFRPPADEVYAIDRSTFVEETSLSSTLEGKSRPGHFRGVCTVVAKLFNILTPDAAVFGEKDFQQLAIICRMVSDLNRHHNGAHGSGRRRPGMQLAQSVLEFRRTEPGIGAPQSIASCGKFRQEIRQRDRRRWAQGDQ